MVEILAEIIASIGALYGALMMLKHVKSQDPLDRYKGFWGFVVSNMMIIMLSISVQAYPMFLQMIAFMIPSTIGIMQLTKQKKTMKIIMSLFYSVIIIFTYEAIINLDMNSYNVNLDTYAAPIAVIGSFVLVMKDMRKRKYAFLIFIIADFIYIVFTMNQSWYILMVQYAIFVGIATKSFLDSMNQENPIRIQNT